MSELASALGVKSKLLPMSDQPVATKVNTPIGLLDFQDYFVARHQQDDVLSLEFEGAATARPNADALAAIANAEVVVFCPSNPLVSIGPILAVDGYRDALISTNAPVIAVSPIIAGKALKGPADKMLATLGHEVSSAGVARIYQELIDGLVIDEADESLQPAIEVLGIRVLVTRSVMGGAEDRARLAAEVLEFGRSLAPVGAAG
jgi:LPPG:FO 2-phospho-L-lactate transferase